MKDFHHVMIAVVVAGSIVFVLWTLITSFLRSRQISAVSKLQHRLLDRFDSSSELTAFLGTPAGGRFFEAITRRPEQTAGRALRALQVGIVLSTLGLAFVTVGLFLIRDGAQDLAAVGVLVFGLGLGFVLAAWVSHRLLGSWVGDKGSTPTLPREDGELD